MARLLILVQRSDKKVRRNNNKVKRSNKKVQRSNTYNKGIKVYRMKIIRNYTQSMNGNKKINIYKI